MTHVCMWEDCFVLEKANNFVKKILVLVSVSAHKHGPVGAVLPRNPQDSEYMARNSLLV